MQFGNQVPNAIPREGQSQQVGNQGTGRSIAGKAFADPDLQSILFFLAEEVGGVRTHLTRQVEAASRGAGSA